MKKSYNYIYNNISKEHDYPENVRITFGKIICARRKELNLSQDSLSTGLCDSKTISRIEHGTSFPSTYILDSILERLGISEKMYYSAIFNSDFEIEDLQFQIVNANSKGDLKKSKDLIEQLKLTKDAQKPIVKQFIMRTENIVNTDGHTPQKKIEILTETLQLTLKNFNIDNFAGRFLSREELKTISNISNIYADLGDFDKSTNILYQLLESIDKNNIDLDEKANNIIFITCRLSQDLCDAGRISEGIYIAEIGINTSKYYNKSAYIGELMANKAYCLCKQGDMPSGKLLFIKAIIVMESLGHDRNVESIIKSLKKEYNLDLTNDLENLQVYHKYSTN